jgi:hypothetical protein
VYAEVDLFCVRRRCRAAVSALHMLVHGSVFGKRLGVVGYKSGDGTRGTGSSVDMLVPWLTQAGYVGAEVHASLDFARASASRFVTISQDHECMFATTLKVDSDNILISTADGSKVYVRLIVNKLVKHVYG